jgi:hypothetical protein
MVLEEVDQWCFVEAKVTTTIDHVQLVEHNKNMAKAKKIILEFVKDHLIPQIDGEEDDKGDV